MSICNIENISALIDGELTKPEAEEIKAHIDGCISCRSLYDDFLAVSEAWPSLEADAPDTLAPGIMYKISLGDDPPRSKRVIGSLVGIAACLIAALLIYKNILPDRQNTDPLYGVYSENAPGDAATDGLATQDNAAAGAGDDQSAFYREYELYDAENGVQFSPGDDLTDYKTNAVLMPSPAALPNEEPTGEISSGQVAEPPVEDTGSYSEKPPVNSPEPSAGNMEPSPENPSPEDTEPSPEDALTEDFDSSAPTE